MPTLDVETLLGRRICKGLRATSVLAFDCFVVVGTDAGCVLAFSQNGSEDDASGVCFYAQAIHHGSVHSLSVSTLRLIASAGHDAAPVVQPTVNLLKNGSERVVRLRGHTLPVTAMSFFSTGSWLATCGMGGRFIIFDVVACSSLCDVGVGFSLRSLALSPDETCCFVGGTRITRIDLYDRDRPLDPLGRRDSFTPWLQNFSWCSSESGGDVTVDSPPDLYIARINVSEDTLTAIFQPRRSGEDGGAIATWNHGATDFWISRNFRRVREMPQADAPLRHAAFRRVFLEDTGKEERAPLVLRACDGWDSWRRARVFVVRGPPVQKLLPVPSVEYVAPIYAEYETLDEGLAREEERGRVLQAECDELVHRIKSLVNVRRKKRLRERAVV